MKKFIFITTGIILLTISLTSTSFASTACKVDKDCKTAGEKCINGYCANPIDIMLDRPGSEADISNNPTETKAVANLPDVSLESGFKTAMKIILGSAMILTIIAIVVAAIYYITSQGEEDDISKAKNIIVYLLIGMVIMAAAYGIVTGVVQFDFFKAK